MEKERQNEEMAMYFHKHQEHFDKIISIDWAHTDIHFVRIRTPMKEYPIGHKFISDKVLNKLKKKMIDLKIVAPWECLDDDYNLDYSKFSKLKRHREADYG